MPTEVVPSPATRPSPEELVREFGDEYLSIQSLFRFCFVPGGRLTRSSRSWAPFARGTT